MKILMLTPDYYPDVYGGVGIHVTSLVRELSRIKEIDMDIIVIRCERLAENNPKIFKDSNGYTVYEFGAKTRSDMDNSYCSDNFTYTWTHNNVMALEYVSSQLKDKQYDIIHCHDIFPAWIMNYFQGKLNIPVLVTMHTSETDERRMEDPVRGFLCKTADVCIAVSNDLKNDLQKRYGINSIKVIHNGVNPSTIERESKCAWMVVDCFAC